MLNNNRYVSFFVRLAIWAAITYIYIDFSPYLAEHASVANLLHGAYTFLSVSILVSLGRWTVIGLYLGRKKQSQARSNFVLGINRIANILSSLFLIIGAMIALGINPKEFLTSITIVAMAIALLFREYITNMISGLIIMFSEQFSLGDKIKVAEHQGEIIDITLANIVIKNEDDDTIMVPNNLAFTAAFVNHSAQGSHNLAVRFELPLPLAGRVEELGDLLKRSLSAYPEDIYIESFVLKVTGISTDQARFKIHVKMRERARAGAKDIEGYLLRQVLDLRGGKGYPKPVNGQGA